MKSSKNFFDDNQFIGYVSQVRPGDIKIHFPSSRLMQKFQYDGEAFDGGVVGSYILIEGGKHAYLARIYEASLPSSERLRLNEESFKEDSDMHPTAYADIQLVVDMYENQSVRKGISSFVEVGSKVYACPPKILRKLLGNQNLTEDDTPSLQIAGLPNSADQIVNLSPNMLFGRHCAIVGTTGGGKSYTVARIIKGKIEAGYTTKLILLDATGEYKFPEAQCVNVDFMQNDFLDYRKLSITDFVALFKPAGQSQLPSLDEAIRSLKMISQKDCCAALEAAGQILKVGDKKYLAKVNRSKQVYQKCLADCSEDIEEIGAPFDISCLPKQLVNESIYDTDQKDPNKWGGVANKIYDSNSSLGLRIRVRLNSSAWSNIFGFDYYNLDAKAQAAMRDFGATLEDFLKSDTKHIMRVRLDNIPVQENLHAVVVNRLGSILLDRSYHNDDFKNSPVITILDEAHRFLNVTIKDEYAIETKLDAFERIAKECRKRGLFLVLATQRPRDIPAGVLSQMGTFITHRLINEADKLAVANAASEGSQRALAFVPTLGAGEALILSVDLAAPVIVKIDEVSDTWKPDSETPKFKVKKNGR